VSFAVAGAGAGAVAGAGAGAVAGAGAGAGAAAKNAEIGTADVFGLRTAILNFQHNFSIAMHQFLCGENDLSKSCSTIFSFSEQNREWKKFLYFKQLRTHDSPIKLSISGVSTVLGRSAL